MTGPTKRLSCNVDLTKLSYAAACQQLGIEPGLGTIYGGTNYKEIAGMIGAGFICVPDVLLPGIFAWAVEGPTGVIWSSVA